jgi:hypothetical protein
MPQKLFSYQYQGTDHNSYTSIAGLPLFMEMVKVSGLSDSIGQHLQLNSQGWLDRQIIESVMQLNFSGGDCVEDIDRLEADEGLKSLLLSLEHKGMSRKERRASHQRFRKGKDRALPSASAIRRYLEKFHNEEEEEKRLPHTAFVPAPNKALKALTSVNQSLINFLQRHQPSQLATLDQDATLAETHKRSAKYCYKNYQAYHPFNTYWHEQGLLLHSEFRDGNVTAGFEQARLLSEALDCLPASVKKVYLRSDTAAYQRDLLSYCAEGQNKRFGVIEFAIGVTVTPYFKDAVLSVKEEDWQPLYKKDEKGRLYKTNQDWAEVCFVPNWIGRSMKNPEYRYIGIREHFSSQPYLPGLEPEVVQEELPFQTLVMKKGEYKIFGVVTNRDLPGSDLIGWYRQRCGDSEKVHSMEKRGLSGGQFPSNKFGANAAWWHMMVLAFNIIALMRKLVLPEGLIKKQMKGLRFHLIHIAGCVVQHARQLIIKVSSNPKIMDLLQFIRQKIESLATPPPPRGRCA